MHKQHLALLQKAGAAWEDILGKASPSVSGGAGWAHCGQSEQAGWGVEGRWPAAPKHIILRTQPGHTSQSPELPGQEGKRTQVTSWFKSFDLEGGGSPLRFYEMKSGNKARRFAAPTYLFSHVRKMTDAETLQSAALVFRGSSALPRGSPPLRAAGGGHRLGHAEPRPPGAGATSGSGRRSEPGGGAALAGLDNREAPAGLRGRQVDPSPRPAGPRGGRCQGCSRSLLCG